MKELEDAFYQICKETWKWLDKKGEVSKEEYHGFLLSKVKEYTDKSELIPRDIDPIISGFNYARITNYSGGTVSLREVEEKIRIPNTPPGAPNSTEKRIVTKTIDIRVKRELKNYAEQFVKQIKYNRIYP